MAEKINGISGELWKEVVKLTQSMLKEKGLHYDFNPPKYDGSHVKMKGSSGVCFAFALNSREVWIELEIKAKNGQPQESVYNQINAKSDEIEKNLGYKIRWDKEDIIISSRREAGGDYRIKTVMPFSLSDIRSRKSNTVEAWAERMVLFIQAFSPFLPGIGHHREPKKVAATLRETYLPEKSHIELAESQLRKSDDEFIDREVVLDQVEANFTKAGKPLKDNWRNITRRNIEIWFGK